VLFSSGRWPRRRITPPRFAMLHLRRRFTQWYSLCKAIIRAAFHEQLKTLDLHIGPVFSAAGCPGSILWYSLDNPWRIAVVRPRVRRGQSYVACAQHHGNTVRYRINNQAVYGDSNSSIDRPWAGVESELSGFVGGSGDHSPLVGLTADHHRFAPQFRVEYLLHCNEESIQIDVHD
jgi:hypothetical protein